MPFQSIAYASAVSCNNLLPCSITRLLRQQSSKLLLRKLVRLNILWHASVDARKFSDFKFSQLYLGSNAFLEAYPQYSVYESKRVSH